MISESEDVYNEPTGFTKVCAAINEHLYGAGMSDSTVVNIGCGTGEYVIALSSRAGHVTGIEPNTDNIRQAMEKTSSLKNVKLIQGDPLDVPLPDGCCDIAFCTLNTMVCDLQPTNGELSKLKQFVHEVARITKDKIGLFVIYSDSQEMVKTFLSGTSTDERRLTDEDLLMECAGKGFHCRSFILNNYDPDYWFGSDTPRGGGHGLHWKDKVKIIDEKRRKIEMDNDKPSGNNKDIASSKTSCTVTYMFSKHS